MLPKFHPQSHALFSPGSERKHRGALPSEATQSFPVSRAVACTREWPYAFLRPCFGPFLSRTL